ncbi:hypothetical protein CL630_01950 [bacterium]|nr:hypothetical protein [bacterium]
MFDSFEGCGEKHWTKYDKYLKNASQNKNWKTNTMWKADEEDVYETCEMLGVKNVKVVKGFVQDTLPDNEIGDIAVLRLDMDLYEPTKCALEILYDNVVEGGIIVFDDYGVKGFRGATWALHEFLVEQKLYHPIYWYPHKGKAYIIKKYDPDIKNFNDSKKRN